jgi:hypothetical protein
VNGGGSVSEIDSIEAVFFALTLLIAGIHLYLGLFAPDVSGSRSVQFLLIGVAFLAGFLIRLTPLWQPLLYLLAVGFAIFLAAIWILGDAVYFTISVVTGVAATAFVVLAVYLFVREESRASV